jgi:transcriptional regulator with XRE-family HTH domain
LLHLLRETREKNGLRQVDVAAALGCPQTRVSKYELGTRRLDLLELRDVCKVLGIPLIDFVRAFDDTVAVLEGEVGKMSTGSKSKRRFDARSERSA